MNVYHYDRKTGEYLGVSPARVDPLESAKQGYEVYLIPAHATNNPPPPAGLNQCARRTGKGWELVADYRGQIYYDKEKGQKVTIADLGTSIPAECPRIAPYHGMIEPKWSGVAWIETAVLYQGVKVQTKADVDKITTQRIINLGEHKATTEKILAGTDKCPIWDTFIASRAVIIKEGDEFILTNHLS